MVSTIRIVLLIASVTHVLGFCGSHTHLHTRSEGEVAISNFGYSGHVGPFDWASLDVGNSACSTGTRQSPINMAGGQFRVISGRDVKIRIPDFPEGLEFQNLGTTVTAVTEGKGATLNLKGVEYELKQFHFHHPSEHLDDGTSLPLEMHMVFQNPEEGISVIGVYIDLDPGPRAMTERRGIKKTRHAKPDHDNLWKKQVEQKFTRPPITASERTNAVPSGMLDTLFHSVDKIAARGTKIITQSLIMSELVESLKLGDFQSYSGSLTTPPCMEGINWMVATQKLQISTAAFERVRDVVKFNQRFTQNDLGQPNVLDIH